MALDIHKMENGKAGELLFSINDSSYSKLEPAFELYKNKTGIFIDPYGNRKLSSGFEPLINSLNEVTTKENEHLFKEIVNVLSEAEANNYGVIFVGD